MKLRKLELQDAPYMFEWMHDKNVIQWMQVDFMNYNLEDCENFIRNSYGNEKENIHRAVIDNNNIYMGTVSLKHITEIQAEFAIVIRSVAMGKDISRFAMEEIIKIGFEKVGLKKIYWCVSKKNKRAINFYDKNGYQKISAKMLKTLDGYTLEQIRSYIWYIVENN